MVTSFSLSRSRKKTKTNEHETFLNLNFVTVRSATLDSTDSQTFHAPRGEEATVGERELCLRDWVGERRGAGASIQTTQPTTTLPKQKRRAACFA